MPEPPLLSPDDFTRLVKNWAAYLAPKLGGPAASGGPWPAALAPRLHEAALKFFDLEPPRAEPPRAEPPSPEPPRAGEAPEDYARRLWEAWAGRDNRSLVFSTSGSTGRPRLHPHPERLLRQEAKTAAACLDGAGRILTAAPAIHSYGFIFGLLAPKTLGRPVLEIPPWPAPALWREDDFLIAFPLFLERLEPAPRPPRGLRLMSAGAPCRDEFFSRLKAWGFAGLLEIFGTSETGALGARQEPGPFALWDYWRPDGPASLRRLLPEGGEAPYPLSDKLDWAGAGLFRPQGRLDRAVQVAGVNVYPERAARLIKAHPAVEFCQVRLEEREGRLKAHIALKPGTSPRKVRQELAAILRRRLRPPERPAGLIFGPAPTPGPLGKLSRDVSATAMDPEAII